MSELQALGEFLEKWGWPVLVSLLLIVGVLVPRWVLKRSDSLADRAMDIAEGQIGATNDVTEVTKEISGAVKSLGERQSAFEARLEASLADFKREVAAALRSRRRP